MSELRLRKTYVPLFFNRFHLNDDKDFCAKEPLDLLSFSLISEIERLFGSRTVLKMDQILQDKDGKNKGLPGWYGLPEEILKEATNRLKHPKIKKTLELLLKWYEPRLHDAKVSLEGFDATTQSLKLMIAGNIYFEKKWDRVRFTLDL